MTWLDCQRCGACCCNSAENQAEGYPWYVPVDDPRSKLLHDPTLRKRHVVESPDGEPHMRLDPAGRCSALKGRLGGLVSCQVYASRPSACRRVQPGDPACLRARREKGIDKGTSWDHGRM